MSCWQHQSCLVFPQLEAWREQVQVWLLIVHCEFSVGLKNWQICAVAYKFGFLLPLLFLGDMNKFLSKRKVLWVELFSMMSSDVGLQPAGLEHRQSEQHSVWNCALLYEAWLQDLPPLGRRKPARGGLGAFVTCTCKYGAALPSKHSCGAKALKKASTKDSLTFGSGVWCDGCRIPARGKSCSLQQDLLYHGFVPEFCICLSMGKK